MIGCTGEEGCNTAGFWAVDQGLREYGDMAPLNFDIAGTHVYNPTSCLSPTSIHIVDSDPYCLLSDDHDIANEVIELESRETP